MATPTPGGLARTYLPSDPDFLLDYMAGIGSDKSEDEFEGYLTDEDESLCGQDSDDRKEDTMVGLNGPSPLPSSILTSSPGSSLGPPNPSQQDKEIANSITYTQ